LAGCVLQALLRIITHRARSFAPALGHNCLGTGLPPGGEPLYLVNLAVNLPLGPGGMFVNHTTRILTTLATDKNSAFNLQTSPSLAGIILEEVLNAHALRTDLRCRWPGRDDLIDHLVVRLGWHEPSLARAHVILPHHPKDLATCGCRITLRNSR